jgi:hypothetical protein
MKPRVGFCLAVSLLTSHLSRPYAADGFQFLELQAEARRAAMGGAGAALSDDAGAFAANPAALGETGRDELSLSYMSYVEGGALGAAAYAHPLASGAGWGLRALSLDHGTFDGFDAMGDKSASYGAKDLSLALGYGRPLGASWRWGASAGHVRSTLADASADTVEAGFGLLWAPAGVGPFSRLRLGAAVRHLGSGGSFEKEQTALPRVLAAGASWRGFSDAWILAVDAEKPRTGSAGFKVGQEIWFSRVLALRAGYRSDRDLAESFSLGLGVRFRDLRVDYAFAASQGSFAEAHRLGFSWRFGGKAEALYEEAARLMQRGDPADAALKLKKVLDLEPRHRGALLLLREAAERMKDEEPPK